MLTSVRTEGFSGPLVANKDKSPEAIGATRKSLKRNVLPLEAFVFIINDEYSSFVPRVS